MFDQSKADRICERLAKGESLRKAAEAEDSAHSTVLLWVDTIPAFADQYARARDTGYRLLADELVDISDGSGEAQRDRLRVDTRKWLLSKMLPKLCGEKLTTELTGINGGPVQIQSIERRVVDPANPNG